MIVVGDLLSDPEAQSFISVEDADAYLAPEARTAWSEATTQQKEAALVVASRWLVTAVPWTVLKLSGDSLVRVGRVAARVAVEALTRDLMAPQEPGAEVKRETVGPLTVEYRDAVTGVSGGLLWPWLRPMLSGLVSGSGAAKKVIRT